MSSVTPLAVLNHFSLPDGGGRGGDEIKVYEGKL